MVHFCSFKMYVVGQMFSVDQKLQIHVLNIPH